MNRFLMIVFSFAFVACTEKGDNNNDVSDSRVLDYTSEVSFLGPAGEEISTVIVALADDHQSRSEGLMDVHHLPENAGMLFIFEGDEPRSFWMANTPLPLDIIFVNSDFEIVRIHRNTSPFSHESIPSELPAKYVVEVNAGYTLLNDIREGMHIRFNELPSSPEGAE